jgi:ATP synthase protein I
VKLAATKLWVFEMSMIAPVPQHREDEAEVSESAFAPLTAEQAQALREETPPTSPWRVIVGQLGVGFLMALAAWGVTGRPNAGWSAGYGALAVVIPAALFARGLMSQFSSINAMTAGFGFFVWEAIKIAVSVGMLIVAPRLVTDLDWLAMLIGLIVTLKVYWVALLMRPKLNKDRLKS